VGERGRQLAVKIGIVLDHEETQGEPSRCRPRASIPTQNRDRSFLLCHYIRLGESWRKGRWRNRSAKCLNRRINPRSTWAIGGPANGLRAPSSPTRCKKR